MANLNKLNIACWNSNGLKNHLLELKLFLSNHNTDIMLISESHLKKTTNIKFNGYKLYHSPHPSDKCRGGSALLIKDNIKHLVLPSTETNAIQSTNIKLICCKEELTIASVYFPPNYPTTIDHYDKFFKSLGNRFIAGGDFN